MPAEGETERAPNVSKDVWDAAGERAKREGLPLVWVISRALADYGAGLLPLPRAATTAPRGNRRGRSIFATSAVWSAADRRRTTDGVRSMSALCEILLDAYAREEIHVHAVMVTTEGRDALTASAVA